MSQVFPHRFLIKKKTIFKLIGFIIKKYGWESLRHAFLYVIGPETHKNACPRSYPPYFGSKKNNL